MRPTFSIIAFTVLSGIGYGAWFLLGLGLAIGPVSFTPGNPLHYGGNTLHARWLFVDPLAFVVAFALVIGGLLCSLGHLGQPQRAWRALSQWRSSWLSREGVLALATFVPALGVAVALLMPQTARYLFDTQTRSWLGIALALGAVATVYCTSKIYASLKTVRAWHDTLVTPAYLLLSLHGGALLLSAMHVFGATSLGRLHVSAPAVIVLLSAALGAWLKRRYWRSIDAQPVLAAGRATGLDALGAVRPLEAPHTEENYLVHEMGFVLARRHARTLRRITLVAAFLVPAVLAAVALAVPAIWLFAAWLALASGVTGLFVERWLFFAEAKHAVMAYYAR